MGKRRCGYVYILASYRGGTLYVGMTTDIMRRLETHRTHAHPDSFTARYGVMRLVHLERFDLVTDAIAREKRLKKWKREWKVALIEEANPGWEEIEAVLDD